MNFNGNGRMAILSELRSAIWAIVPEYIDGMLGAIESGVVIEFDGQAEPEPYEARVRQLPSAKGNAVAVLPIRGPITQHGFGGLLDAFIGGTKLDAFGPAFDAVVANKDIGAVVLDVDSPGGTVYGVTEMAARIRAAEKPVVAVANSMAASAAYAIGSAASQMVVTSSGQVGSIGVLQIHVDTTAAEEADGYKTTIISAGEHKAEGWTTLTDGAKAAMQHQVDAYYETFVSDVGKGRSVAASVVKEKYGQGRVVNASDALAAGMVDRIATLDEVIGSVSKSKTPRRDAAMRRMRMMEFERAEV